MPLYEVFTHGYGRPIVKHGGAAGLPDFPKHEWINITPRPSGLARARALADAQPHHAVVVVAHTSQRAYDNGKTPHLPAGWMPEHGNRTRTRRS